MLSIAGTLMLIIIYLVYVRHLKHLPLVLLTLTVAALLAENLSVFDWNGITQSVSRTIEADGMASITTGRTPIYSWVFESLEGHWLFGLGPQGFWHMPNRAYGVQTHNMLLQFLVEWGLLGAAIFMLLLLRAGASILGTLKNKNEVVSASFFSSLAVLVSLSIHGLVSGTFYYSQPSFYLALCFAICLSAVAVTKKNNSAEITGVEE